MASTTRQTWIGPVGCKVVLDSGKVVESIGQDVVRVGQTATEALRFLRAAGWTKQRAAVNKDVWGRRIK